MNAVSAVTLVASLGGFLFGADIVLVALALPYMARGGSDPVEGISTSLNQSLVVVRYVSVQLWSVSTHLYRERARA